MLNIFLSRKIFVFTAIFFGGLLITAGVLAFFGFKAFEPIAAAQSSEWTQETGLGISVPACGSSTPLATCLGGVPHVTFTWAVDGPDPDGFTCTSASITAGPSGGAQSIIATGEPCSGGPYSWSGATLFNTTYTYSINFENGGHVISSGSFQTPGYCTAPAPLPPPPTVSCSVFPISATTGEDVTWTAVPSGGTAGAASGVINQSFSNGGTAGWMTTSQDQTISARRFQASSSYWLKKVSLALAREATLTGRLRVTIENDAGGLPSGNAIIGGTSDLVNVSGICVWGACATWLDFTFPGAELTAGTNYWIVLRGYIDNTLSYGLIHWSGAPLDSDVGAKSLVRYWTIPNVWTDARTLWGTDLWYRTYAASSPPAYSYSWAGSTPSLDSQAVNPVDISYTSTGPKTGSVNVTSGGQSSGSTFCSNSVDIAPNPIPTVDLSASPFPSVPWNTASTLSWTSTDATSCTASGAWSGSRPASGSESTGNITAFPSTYTMTCTGPGGESDPDSVTINQSTPNLTINLTASPASDNIPLSVDLTGSITAYDGNPDDSINYTFWWDCDNLTTSVAAAISACGDPDGVGGNVNGQKFDGVDPNTVLHSRSVTHIYSLGGTYKPKVIIERSSADPKTALATVNAIIPPLAGLSCNVNPRTVKTGDNVTWSATWSGGQPDYTVIWSGDAPLPRTIISSGASSSVTVQYNEPGEYDGSVEVQSLDDGGVTQTQGPVTCLSTVKVAPKFKLR